MGLSRCYLDKDVVPAQQLGEHSCPHEHWHLHWRLGSSLSSLTPVTFLLRDDHQPPY